MFGPLLFLVTEGLSSIEARTESTYPWKYDNMFFEGPDYWGVHSEWVMCSRGKLQSPIDIRPSLLLHDPSLRPIHIDRISVGQTLFYIQLNRYRIQRIDIHFGVFGHANGSEHAIDGRKFPMELQLLAFNADLYTNFSQASKAPHGIAAISVLVEYGGETNEELLKLTIATASVQYKSQRVELADLSPWKLLPRTRDFLTYEGSITSPPCDETVQWIVLNQPIHIHPDDYAEWSKLSQLSPTDPPVPIAPNCRTLAEANQRTVRTNILMSKEESSTCSAPRVTYKVLSNQKEHGRAKRKHHSPPVK
ncbi:unnamed protein product, partial [Mesorhabditis spiculigera]